tara:strand:- start:6325 stop:6765 length:441 start_codon:yes stop_codon:yes gene_type:complete
MSKVTNGNIVSVHYKGTLNDGSQFDSSYDRGEPIQFTVGSGQMIPGFEKNVVGMTVGEAKEFTLTPEDAYGERTQEAIHEVSKEMFPDGFTFEVGAMIQGEQDGRPLLARIISEQESTVELDFNHPMAGQDLTFNIEVVDINEESN